MKMTTIWTLRGMSLRERLNRTGEAFMRSLAHRLPRRLAYWSFIDTGVRHLGDDVVPEVAYMTVLERAAPGRVPTCPAVLNVVGEHFPCDWPVDRSGRHPGFAHSSAAAQAIWADDPAVLKAAWASAEAAGR